MGNKLHQKGAWQQQKSAWQQQFSNDAATPPSATFFPCTSPGPAGKFGRPLSFVNRAMT
jgi:hypothetical protein